MQSFKGHWTSAGGERERSTDDPAEATLVGSLGGDKCLNCSCLVFARDPLENPTALLVNPSLATTAEAISQRMAQENYSPAYRIMLDGRAADFRGFYRKDEYRSLFNAAANTLDSTNDSNELLEQLRAFMRAETQLANERIARFTQELNEQLCNMRDRAEQDYLFLAQSFVPELEDNKSGVAAVPTTTTAGNAVKMPTMVRSTIPAKALAQLMTNVTTTAGAGGVADTQPGSQMETPPPTPECMPMSTGNSPPSMVHGGSSGGGGGATNGGSGALRSQSIAGMRPALSNSVANTINNNTTTNRGAINKPPTQQQQQQQHSSSTNLFANHNSGLTASSPGMPGVMSAHRFSSNSGGNNHALDADCLFDIDGMENDKTPPPDAYSDEDECDYDDTTDNNNQEGGMRIPRLPYRQNSSIARSLPISTPKPMTPFRGNDDDLDEMTEEAVDIAASIKAIAKSVHGDAVFGDLPRRQIQKFTSQI
ncbi:AGAP012282-PA-like protein [Anopheles sinensis]|uniref:AGAP012282-PA-like protein n=1 Tax=Anopheles sinensis TaxID=74873 RepID=A0A084WHX1_ANOSI|nr:AGAP012282-PA-like protein [Anopheles sinensis]